MPQLTPAFMFAALLSGSLTSNWLALLIAIVFSALIPTASIIVYWESGMDFFVDDKRKRVPLFITGTIAYSIGAILLFYIHAPFIATALMLAYAINTIVAAGLNVFYKVSIHTWGISGPTAALFFQFGVVALLIGFSMAFLVGIQRVATKAHTVGQVVAAVLVSFPLTIFVIYHIAPALIV